MKLIVGLGNPGRSYAQNRHNIGFMCLSHFAKRYNIQFSKRQSQARVGDGEVGAHRVVLAKPQTFMNNSGKSVVLLVKRFGISLDGLVVIHDDLDLELGKIRLRQGSSSGGHKGINSIINHLGNQDFVRLRVGIGRPGLSENHEGLVEGEVIDHVLGDFTFEEKKVIEETLPRLDEAIFCFLTEGLTVAMNRYN